MRVVARFNGRNGEISVIEEVATGARYYHEAGVFQSYVLPGGQPGLAYVRLMTALLAGGKNVLLVGCGGGALATMLYRLGRSVTVIDDNPISFELARQFFWMPRGIRCIAAGMREFLSRGGCHFDAIGVDVGGPSCSYEDVLDHAACARLRAALHGAGRIAVNIACDRAEDPAPDRIGATLESEELDVWLYEERPLAGRNVVILASTETEHRTSLRAHAERGWRLRRRTAV